MTGNRTVIFAEIFYQPSAWITPDQQSICRLSGTLPLLSSERAVGGLQGRSDDEAHAMHIDIGLKMLAPT